MHFFWSWVLCQPPCFPPPVCNLLPTVLDSSLLCLCTNASAESALLLHMGGKLSWVGGSKEWSRVVRGSACVTARAACSGSRLGSVRMAVVVLRRRSELRTTEKIGKQTKTKPTQWISCHSKRLTTGFDQHESDSLGLRAGREQCWSSQDMVVRHSSAALAVDTMPL